MRDKVLGIMFEDRLFNMAMLKHIRATVGSQVIVLLPIKGDANTGSIRFNGDVLIPMQICWVYILSCGAELLVSR